MDAITHDRLLMEGHSPTDVAILHQQDYENECKTLAGIRLADNANLDTFQKTIRGLAMLGRVSRSRVISLLESWFTYNPRFAIGLVRDVQQGNYY
jgi:hypothetical protein